MWNIRINEDDIPIRRLSPPIKIDTDGWDSFSGRTLRQNSEVLRFFRTYLKAILNVSTGFVRKYAENKNRLACIRRTTNYLEVGWGSSLSLTRLEHYPLGAFKGVEQLARAMSSSPDILEIAGNSLTRETIYQEILSGLCSTNSRIKLGLLRKYEQAQKEIANISDSVATAITQYQKLAPILHSEELLEKIDNYTGTQFEYFIAKVFENAGYSVRVVGGSNDQGIDVVAVNDSNRFGIQCKRYKRDTKVSAETIHILAGALSSKKYKSEKLRGLVVTSSYFTADATNRAKDQEPEIELWDRSNICTKLIELNEAAKLRKIRIDEYANRLRLDFENLKASHGLTLKEFLAKANRLKDEVKAITPQNLNPVTPGRVKPRWGGRYFRKKSRRKYR